jgi:hypothetical protein
MELDQGKSLPYAPGTWLALSALAGKQAAPPTDIHTMSNWTLNPSCEAACCPE